MSRGSQFSILAKSKLITIISFEIKRSQKDDKELAKTYAKSSVYILTHKHIHIYECIHTQS